MSGGKKNPAVLWHKLGCTSTKVAGIVKTFRNCSNKEFVFDMVEQQLIVNDTDGDAVILGPKEIEAIYFTAKSMGWMNHD